MELMDIRKCNILLPYSCRSDTALTQPIINRLEKEDWCNLTTIPLVPANYFDSFKRIEKHLSLCTYDLAYITGDRVEMGAAAQAAFLNSLKIAHYGGGITNTIATFDDLVRHQITLISDIYLCEDIDSALRVGKLLEIIGKIKLNSNLKEQNIYVVGNLYLDSINDIDISLVPKKEYDLILINYTKDWEKDVKEVMKLNDKQPIWIGSNPDGNIKINGIQYYDNLPRNQFLGFLKFCHCYLTNSSSAYYETFALGLKENQIKMIGDRNKMRSTPKNLEGNAGNKIVSILKKWWENKNGIV